MPDADTPQTGDSSEQKRFIRTFAGDIAAVKAGETPDLQPLASDEKSEPDEVPVLQVPKPPTLAPEPWQAPAVSPPPVPMPPPAVPAPIAAPEPPPEPEEDKQAILARLRAKVAASSIEKIPAPVPTPETPQPSPEEPSRIHTYSSDFSEKVQDTHASTASILAAQQDAGPAPKRPAPETNSKAGIIFMVSGIVLLLLGGGGAFVAYQAYQNRALPVIIAPVVSAPIFVDDRSEVTGTSTALETMIVQSASTPLASDGVRFLYTVTSTSTDQSIFSALQLPAPGILLRNIDAKGSMAGIVQLHGVPSVFFILSVQSYSDTFAGMLLWEPTMPRDLAQLFPSYPTRTIKPQSVSSTTATTTTASSTPTSTTTPAQNNTDTTAFTLLYKAGFFDQVVASHDARAYRDTAGETLFVYSYASPSTLILARNEAALTEILSRISTSRSK